MLRRVADILREHFLGSECAATLYCNEFVGGGGWPQLRRGLTPPTKAVSVDMAISVSTLDEGRGMLSLSRDKDRKVVVVTGNPSPPQAVSGHGA